jgi:hypothetical protein
MPSQPEIENRVELSDRVSLRVMRARKWRIWRNLLLMTVVTAVIIVLAMLQRDSQSMRRAARETQHIVSAFHRTQEATGTLPERLPPLENRPADVWNAYYFNPAYTRQAQRGELTGVVCPRDDLRMYLGESGRYIVVYRAGQFESRWMKADEFKQAATRLGLGPAAKSQ